jgi:succinoglycan biosynthesis transport protein ExoP
MPGLYLLSSGHIPPAPISILDTVKMSSLIHELKGMFEVLVIDSPPALGIADATLLSQFADALVLVLSYLHETRRKLAG